MFDDPSSPAVDRCLAPLTPHQRRIALLLADDAPTNAIIARRLGVSENTVKRHVQRLTRRLGVETRTAVVVMIWRARLQHRQRAFR